MPRYELAAVALVANALRHLDAAARVGETAVPDWFHPGIHGRIVMERGVAMAWALSPTAAWEDVYGRSNDAK